MSRQLPFKNASTNEGCGLVCDDYAYQVDYDGLDLDQVSNPGTVCPLLQNSICSIVICCPTCQAESQTLFQCQEGELDGLCGDDITTEVSRFLPVKAW